MESILDRTGNCRNIANRYRYMKAGFIAYFFPTSVITALLTGIGLLIILKLIPHVLGYDKDF